MKSKVMFVLEPALAAVAIVLLVWLVSRPHCPKSIEGSRYDVVNVPIKYGRYGATRSEVSLLQKGSYVEWTAWDLETEEGEVVRFSLGRVVREKHGKVRVYNSYGKEILYVSEDMCMLDIDSLL